MKILIYELSWEFEKLERIEYCNRIVYISSVIGIEIGPFFNIKSRSLPHNTATLRDEVLRILSHYTPNTIIYFNVNQILIKKKTGFVS